MSYDELHEIADELDLNDNAHDELVGVLQQDTISKEDVIRLLDKATEDEEAQQVFILGPEDAGPNPAKDDYDWVVDLNSAIEELQLADVQFEDIEKSSPGSTRDTHDIGQMTVFELGISGFKAVKPPFCAEGLRQLLELDPVHFRACKAKAIDSVIRGFNLVPAVPVQKLDEQTGTEDDDVGVPTPPNAVSQDVINEETVIAQEFFDRCHPVSTIEDLLEKLALDYEAIGWCALEVIRDLSGRVRYLEHIPAERVRVLEKHKGFVEITQQGGEIYPTFYQMFGDKHRSPDRVNQFTKMPEPWDPLLDGPDIEESVPYYVDRKTGERTTDVTKAANEIIFRSKNHSRSIYYGVPDIIPAVSHVLANVELRDYRNQFFTNNTVPRYAIVLSGARLSDDDVNKVKKYFEQEVRGAAHRTLFIPLRSNRGNVKLDFVRLDADQNEGSFHETEAKNDEHIMVAHGTPPAILGVHEAASLGSGKGMSQAEIYKDRIVDPSQRGWAAFIKKILCFGLGLTHIKPEFDPLDTRDRQAEMEVHKGYVEMGARTINEVRDLLGFDPVKGGDRPFVLLTSGMEFIDRLHEALSSSEERLAIAEEMANAAAESEPEPEQEPSNDSGDGDAGS